MKIRIGKPKLKYPGFPRGYLLEFIGEDIPEGWEDITPERKGDAFPPYMVLRVIRKL
jgi:hypothetical protein